MTTGAVLGLSLVVADERYQAAFGEGAIAAVPVPQLSLALMIVTFMLIALWYFAVAGELEMLKEWAEEFVPSLLAYASKDALAYAAIFISLKSLELIGSRSMDSKIREALLMARQQAGPDDERRAAWDVIENYYLIRPKYLFGLAIITLGLLALTLAVGGELVSAERWLSSAAFAILIAALVVNEAIYFRWRKAWDSSLGDRYS